MFDKQCMTHLVDNLRFVWLGSASAIVTTEGWIVNPGRLKCLSQLLLTQAVSVLLYQFVKWLSVMRWAWVNRLWSHSCPEWAWTVSRQSRNSWMFKSDWRCVLLHGANWQSREYCRTHHPVCIYHVPQRMKLDIKSVWTICPSTINFVLPFSTFGLP